MTRPTEHHHSSQISDSDTGIEKLVKTTEDIRNLLTTIMIECTDKPKKKSKSMKNDEMKKKLEVDELKCKLCDQTFVKSFKIERHVKSSHETYQEYECQICEKKFVTKWRLKKHKLLHSGKVKSHCRYFRNNVTCPLMN